MPKKGWAWTVCRFKGGVARKGGGCFGRGVGVDTPMHTMETKFTSSRSMNENKISFCRKQ